MTTHYSDEIPLNTSTRTPIEQARSDLDAALYAEAAARAAADSTETAARIAADASINTWITATDTLNEGYTNDINDLQADLTAETATRASADASLQSQVDALSVETAISGGTAVTTLARVAASAPIASIGGDGTTTTVTTTVAHQLVDGDFVRVAGTTNYNGESAAIDVLSTTQFTYLSAVNAATETTGTVSTSRLFVVSDDAFVAGQELVVVNDDGDIHPTTVNGTPAANVIVLTAAVPTTWSGTAKASIGATVGSTLPEIVQSRGAINTNQTLTLPDTIEYAAANTYNVKAYGAAGDGATLDRTAIQAAIAAANAAGGGTVYFPKGTYLLNLTTTAWLIVYDNITLAGEGKQSILKVQNSNGNYNTVIGASASGIEVSNFTVRNLTIDHNGDNNAIAAESDLTGSNQYRFSIGIFKGTNIKIHDCDFINVQNVNCITLNGALVGGLWIQRNRFLVGGSAVYHDHSTIYANTADTLGPCIITDNHFVGRAVGTYGAVTAIEVHGSNHMVERNYIENFVLGMYVTGVRTGNINVNHHIKNNTITNCLRGINLLPVLQDETDDGTYGVDHAMKNIYVTGNSLTIERQGWAAVRPTSQPEGIMIHPSATGTIKGLFITDNRVFFNTYTDTGSADLLAGGIGLRAPSQYTATVFETVTLARNTVENSPSMGILIWLTNYRNFLITDNLVVNPGRSPGSFSTGYRVGIYLAGTATNVTVARNHFIDNQATATMTIGILDVMTAITNGVIRDNMVARATGSVTSFSTTATTDAAAWHLRHRGNTAPGTGQYSKFGSVFTDDVLGRSYTQQTSPAGSSWQRSLVLLSGVTAARPASPIVGLMYYDTTLVKPIWYDGTNWKDATGATV